MLALKRHTVLMLIILGSFFFTKRGYAAEAATPLPVPVGKVVWIKGTLKAIMENKEVRFLQKQSVIYLHDILITDSVSQAEIIFTDHTLMTFRQDTKFVISQYVYHPSQKGNSVGKYIMNLVQGGFRTITGLIAKRNTADYEVDTPVATIGVRGTDYAVVLSQGRLLMAYYSGSPCLNNRKGAILCLSASVPYAEVPSAGAQPVPLTSEPTEFNQQLVITPATIANFPTSGGTSGGPITSFCISQ